MRSLRFLIPAALVSVALVGGRLPSAQAQSGAALGSPAAYTGAVHHTNLPSQGFPDTTAHYLYIGTGNCPDSIDVYQVMGQNATLLQNFSTPACQFNDPYGTNPLGYSAPCLVMADVSGHIDSFTVDQSTHMITGLVSEIADPLGGEPTDVQITGNKAIVTSAGVESFAIAANCTLTEISAVAEPGVTFFSSAVVAGKGVVSPGYSSGTMYAFKLAANGTLTYANQTPSQVPAPDSVATSGISVETGYATAGTTQVQAGKIDASGAITFDPNSPQTDLNGLDAAASWYDAVFKHWVVGEQISHSLGFFSKSPFAYVSTISSPDGGNPAVFQQTGPYLTWFESSTNSVDYCKVSVTGCGAPHVVISSIQGGSTNTAGGYVLF